MVTRLLMITHRPCLFYGGTIFFLYHYSDVSMHLLRVEKLTKKN